jgi:CubicO group peptidase (beta-lactamase class C family)
MRFFSLALVLASMARPSTGETAGVAAVIEPFMAQNAVPGLSVAVVRDGELALATGFGRTAPSGGEAVTAATQFRVASVSKVLTATLVLRLVSGGKLQISDRARDRCPAFAPTGGDPELRDLLAHQGGVRHPTDAEDTKTLGDFPRLSESVKRLSNERLRFAPGTDVLYSSWGYAVLGCAVEEVTGGRFFDALRAGVLEPAGMNETVADRPDFGGPGFSGGFRVVGGRALPAAVVDTRFKQPASGIISTASDLARFAVALYGGRLLSEDSRRLLVSEKNTHSGKPSGYTLGMMVGRADNPWGRAVYQTGSMEGATALLYLIPERRYAVVILANRERFVPKIAALLPALNEALLGKP